MKDAIQVIVMTLTAATFYSGLVFLSDYALHSKMHMDQQVQDARNHEHRLIQRIIYERQFLPGHPPVRVTLRSKDGWFMSFTTTDRDIDLCIDQDHWRHGSLDALPRGFREKEFREKMARQMELIQKFSTKVEMLGDSRLRGLAATNVFYPIP